MVTKFHRFKVAKLVRDASPARITKKGFRHHTYPLHGQEYIDQLKDKLLEEAAEVKETSNPQDLIEELADTLEVIHALAKVKNISLDQIEEKRREKAASRGGFDKKLYCEYLDVPANHGELKNFRAAPHKYPEVGDVE